MKRAIIWLFLGYVALVSQVSLLPIVLPHEWRPDLLLILLLTIGLVEPLVPGVFLACLLGALTDVYAGATFGLYAFVNPLFYLLLRAFVGQLNYDSPMLFPILCALGLLLHNALLVFCLLVFTDVVSPWQVVWPRLLPVLLSTFIVGVLLASSVMAVARGGRSDEA